VAQWSVGVADWLAQLGELPSALYLAGLGVIMLLDAIPLVGVLVPGDIVVLAVVGTGRPGGAAGAYLSVITGCVVGWSLSFLAGRHFGDRIRHGRIGAWIGEARWVAAEGILHRGGGRMVMVAPFLPVFNALLPLAAGGLRMSYRRFVSCATLGAALWAGLYVLLGTAANSLGGLLPGESFALLATVGIGLTVGWIVLLGARRRWLSADGHSPPADPSAPGSPRIRPSGLR
jgi:membrane protein DedA with SNARE-associated domain